MSNYNYIPDRILFGQNELVSLFGIESLNIGLSNFIEYLTKSPQEIIDRQEILKDIKDSPILLELYEELYEHICEISEFQKKISLDNDSETLLYSVIEIRSFCSIIEYIKDRLKPLIESKIILSHRMITFIDACCDFSLSEDYINILDWLNNMHNNMQSIKSVTLGANLDPQLQIKEIGIVSFNSDPFIGKGIINSLFRDITPADEYKCMISLGIHETNSLLGKTSISVNREMFLGMNTIYKNTLKRIRKDLLEHFKREILAITAFGTDLSFIINAAKYMIYIEEKGATLVFPKIHNTVTIEGLYLSQLLEKHQWDNIITNDIYMDENNRCFVLTGPNSGGKSVYLNGIAIAQVLFQLGLPIPAKNAEMIVYDSISIIYVQDTKNSKDGRLAEEVRQLKNCIETINGKALILLDETFSSTSAFDGVFLAESLIKYLYKRGVYMVYVTHFHELAQRISSLNSDGYYVKMLTAENINGKRTYRIVPYSSNFSETSLAKDIVIDNGLGFLFDE